MGEHVSESSCQRGEFTFEAEQLETLLDTSHSPDYKHAEPIPSHNQHLAALLCSALSDLSWRSIATPLCLLHLSPAHH